MSNKTLKQIVTEIRSEYPDTAHGTELAIEDILGRGWHVDVKDGAVAMIARPDVNAAMVEQSEIREGEL